MSRIAPVELIAGQLRPRLHLRLALESIGPSLLDALFDLAQVRP
jgi:hypothetical protein